MTDIRQVEREAQKDDLIARLRAEIGRLQGDLQSACTQCDMLRLQIKDSELEIERLKAAHAKFAFEAGERFGEALSAIQELRGEIERLTAENRHLFNVVKDDAMLVERYNAFLARRAQETVERPRISSTE